MSKLSTILGFLFIIFSINAFSNESIERAEQYYVDGNYEAALVVYDSLLGHYPSNSLLLFNAGNAHYKLGHTGKSILYYERAAKYSKKDEHIAHNLKLAQLRANDKIEAASGFFVVTWWNGLAKMKSASGWTFFALLAIWMAGVLLVIYLFASQLSIKKLSFYLGSLFLFMAFFFTGLRSQSIKNLNSHNTAVLQQQSISVKSEPVNGATDLFILHEGVKLTILDESGSWSKIQLADGKEGWINSDVFERI